LRFAGLLADNRVVRRCAILLLALWAATGVFVTSGSGGQVTPTALYRALLATSIPGSSLPAGFSPPVGALKVPSSPDSKLHHVVGVVQIFLNGGADGGVAYGAGAYYKVFPTRQDAVAAYRAEPSAGQAGTPKSFPTPARILNTSLPNGGTKYIAVEYVDRNVSVFVYVTARGANPLPRDALQRVISLATFTLKHLERMSGTG
jgi:hypothetical protein